MSMEPPQIHSVTGLRIQENSWKSSVPEMKVIVTATDSGVLMAVSPSMKTVWRLKTEPNNRLATNLWHTVVHSHWSSNVEARLSLVERFPNDACASRLMP